MVQKTGKRCISLLLTLLIGLSAFTGFPLNASAESVKANVDDVVSVTIDEETVPLTMYAGGIYEAGISLKSGEQQYTLSVNGTAKAENVEIKVPQDEEVYIRYYAHGKSGAKNGAADSVNNTDLFKTSATWTGNFTGLEELNITNWTPADTDGDLDYIGGGRYAKTFKFSALKNALTLNDGGYKVAYNHGWGHGEVNSNVKLTIPKGSTSVTIYADYIQGICTDSINQPQITINQNSGDVTKPAFTTSVQLIGTVRGDDDKNWTADADGWEFTQITNTLYTYSQTFDKGEYSYKTVFDKQYWYEKSGNKSLSIAKDNTNVVFLYDAEKQALYDTVNDYSTVAEKLGYQSEPAKAQVKDNANGTTEFIIPGKSSDKISLTYAPKESPEKTEKVTLTAEKNSDGDFSGSFSSGKLYFGDGKLDYVYYYTVNGKRTLDSSAETVTIDDKKYSEYTRDEFDGRTINVAGSLPGPSWDAASNEMSYLGDGLYSYKFENVPAANYQYKIAIDGKWDENYGMYGKEHGDNISLSVYSTQNVTIYYSDISHLSVTSLNYTFADIDLTGTSISDETKMKDNELTSIYTATVPLTEGTYNNIKITWNDKDGDKVSYEVTPFTLTGSKDVTFYFDPSTELFYCNASDEKIESKNVYFNTQDTKYKSTYGAVEQNKDVTFSIQTGDDVDKAYLFVKGAENKKILMKKGTVTGGKVLWTTKQSFSTIGQYTYYFALVSSSDLKIYCDDDGYYGEGKLTDLSNVLPYDLIVYKSGYKTPDWMKNAVIYQIFPDRFYNADKTNDTAQTTARGATNYEYITDWNKLPENPQQESLHSDDYPDSAYKGDGVWSNEIYGGDIKGVTQKISYLKKLGVNVIYLNPVFSSISSHRYDTTDYKKIDPILGTMGDFTELVKTAKANNMHVILDGVYNHVSDDSIYFDRYYKFVGKDGKVGAYPYWAYVYDYMAGNAGSTQADAEAKAKEYFKSRGVTDFNYTQWFTINKDSHLQDSDNVDVTDTTGERKGKFVYSYEGWWGYDSMPVITATNGSEYQTPGWADELIDGKNSVTQYWLKKGSNGWRLDCGNEVSDETWQKFRTSVKSLGSDNVIIGEIWDDATKYLLGDMYDSVMNYQFRNAVLSYARGRNSSDAVKTLKKIRERYPKEAYYAMMNLVDSHDTTRVLSYLDGIDDDRAQTDVASAFPTYATTSSEAKEKQRMVALIQMTYPGAPTIYYGDEVGVVGADDPDNRRTMDWSGKNKDLFDWYAKLISIRSTYTALRTGSITELSTDSSAIMAYARTDSKNQLIVATNNSSKAISVNLDVSAIKTNKIKNLLTDETIEKSNGTVTVSVPANSGIILANCATSDSGSTHHSSSSVTSPSSTKAANTSSVTKETDGTTTVTVTTVPDSAPAVLNKTASFSVTVTSDMTASASAYATAQKHAKVVIRLPDTEIINQLNSASVQSVNMTLKLPCDIAYGTAKNVDAAVIWDTKILLALKQSNKNAAVSVIDALTGKEAYSWTFKGADLANSTAALKNINMAMNIKTSTLDAALTSAIGSSVKGAELTFANNGQLPASAAIKVYVADQGFKAGQTLYLYYYNAAAKQLETVENSVCKVDAAGYVNIAVDSGWQYVLLPQQVAAVSYVKLDTGKKLTVKAGNSYQFKVTAPKKPVFVCGNGSVFKVKFNGSKGSDYFFIVTAVGNSGSCAGFYVNGEKSPRTIGIIAK